MKFIEEEYVLSWWDIKMIAEALRHFKNVPSGHNHEQIEAITNLFFKIAKYNTVERGVKLTLLGDSLLRWI